MKNKIIGWNINQRSGMGDSVPQFVIDELKAQQADIIVLTELYKGETIDYFWDEMSSAGYEHAITKNDGTNEVGILWKSDLFNLMAVDDSVITEKNNNPNLLLVDLVDNEGKVLSVVGFRIRMASYDERADELGIVIRMVDEKTNPVVMVCDCNNLRRETTVENWNLNVVDKMISAKGFTRNTPKGQSIYSNVSYGGYAYEFPEDHIITRGFKVDLGEYDRAFVYRDPRMYPWGKNFQRYNNKNGQVMSIKPGFPDHAIVKGYIEPIEQEAENE